MQINQDNYVQKGEAQESDGQANIDKYRENNI